MSELWALHEEQSPDTAEHGRPLRLRRSSEQAVVSDLRAWLLQDYVAAYCRSLAETRIFRRCYFIDALGAYARYAPAPQSEMGSEPAPASKQPTQNMLVHPGLQAIHTLSRCLAQESRPITLYGLILAAGSSRRKEKRTREGQQRKPIPKESGLIPASWLEVAPDVLDSVGQSPAIFLLQPLGATTFSYDDLASIYRRTVPTELCLLLSHKQIELLLQAARTASDVAAHLTSLLRSDRWKTLPVDEAQRTQAIEGWLSLFTTSMQRHFLLPVQRIPLITPTGPATIESIPYTLIFATRRQDSLVSMNDAICTHARHVTKASWQGVLGEEWFTAQQQERQREELQRLSQQIIQQGRKQRIRRWPDLRQQLLLNYFGQFTRQDYDTRIWQLLLNGELRCEWRQHAASSQEMRIPGNDDTLIWR